MREEIKKTFGSYYLEITRELMTLKDEKNADFVCRLIPGIKKETVLGIKNNLLKNIAKRIIRDGFKEDYLKSLPHDFHEENLIHMYILGEIKVYNEMIDELSKFLPYISNWAVCDSFSSKTMSKNQVKAYPQIRKWIESNDSYSIRLGTVLLMKYYLSYEHFKEEHIDILKKVKNDDYYVKMGIAWYLSYALIKQYEKTIPYFTTACFNKWIHNKAIQKARDSFRIENDKKLFLNSLKLKQ